MSKLSWLNYENSLLVYENDGLISYVLKTPMLRKIEGKRRSGQQRIRWLDGITDSMNTESEQTLRDGEGQGVRQVLVTE